MAQLRAELAMSRASEAGKIRVEGGTNIRGEVVNGRFRVLTDLGNHGIYHASLFRFFFGVDFVGFEHLW